MKRIITLTIFTLISITMVNAQSFRLGVQASPTFSWMGTNQNTITANGMNLGLEVGLLGDYYLENDRYAISSGISFLTNQGGNLTYSIGGNLFPNSELSADTLLNVANGTEVGYHLQYIEVPLSVKLRGGTGDLGYYVQIPYFSLAFPVQGRADIGTYENENILKSVFPVSFTWGLGAGAEYNINDLTLMAGLTFQSSIIDVVRNKGVLNTGEKEDAKQNLNRVTLRVGVFF
ncbi:MAG: PorT family protein [Saprospiraceae bacterium]|nr:PorT family protein [Saprospiraceae bacterium]